MNIVRRLTLCFIVLIMSAIAAVAQVGIPDAPNPVRFVNDFANLLTQRDVAELEDSIANLDTRESTQIVIVTVYSLDGYDIADYATKLGEKWGIGQNGKNNGVVMVVKPKTAESRGEAFIATGYGVEGVLPDITCSHIINNEMIPHFRENDYGAGIKAGALAVIKAVRGEYTNDEKPTSSDTDLVVYIIAFIIAIIYYIYIAKKNKISSSGAAYSALAASQLGKSSRSSWSSFTSSSGSYSRPRSFGGGHFGGGGGRGSW